MYAVHCIALLLGIIVACTEYTALCTLYTVWHYRWAFLLAVQCTLLTVRFTLYGTTVVCTLYTSHCKHQQLYGTTFSTDIFKKEKEI